MDSDNAGAATITRLSLAGTSETTAPATVAVIKLVVKA